MNDDLVYRLLKRAEIRRSIPRGEPDRISDLLEEAANEIISLSQMVRQPDKGLSSRFDSDREIVNENVTMS